MADFLESVLQSTGLTEHISKFRGKWGSTVVQAVVMCDKSLLLASLFQTVDDFDFRYR